jgi:hypothetical protein
MTTVETGLKHNGLGLADVAAEAATHKDSGCAGKNARAKSAAWKAALRKDSQPSEGASKAARMQG